MLRSLTAFTAVLISLCPAVPAWAATTLFGPKTYTFVAGKPQTVTDAIPVNEEATCDGKAVHTLLVQNNGISSAVVLLNGSELLRESNFPRTPAEVPIALASTNTLSVVLKGGSAGSSLMLSIRRDIQLPIAPSVTHTLDAKNGTFDSTVAIADTNGTFVLEVVNGDSSGTRRVTSGSISINGVTVVAESELTKQARMLRRTVTVANTNAILADLKGAAGDFVSIALRRVADESACSALRVIIATPDDRVVVESSSLIVTGSVAATREVGVVVNGVAAEIDLGHEGTPVDPFSWVANVPVDASGSTVLTAVATNGAGVQASATRNVVFSRDELSPKLDVSPASGLVPLSATFRLYGSLDGMTHYEADLDGDGVFEKSGATFTELASTYSTPGLRVATVRVTRADGTTNSAYAVVNAQTFASLHALFDASWRQFLDKLAAQDIEGALAQLVDRATREKYRRGLEMIRPLLGGFASSTRSFRPMELGGDVAHYLLIRAHTTGEELGYHIYFRRDENGVWKIVQF